MLSDSLHDQLLDYLDGNLSAEASKNLEEQFESNAELKSAWLSLRELQAAGRDWEEVAVPEWSRLAGVTARPGATQFWPLLLGWLSLATSTAAIVMVLFSGSVTVSAEGFTVAFNGDAASDTAFEQRLGEFQRRMVEQQDSIIGHRVEMLEARTMEINRQLLAAALSYSRDERRREMTALATSWNRARNTDLLLVDGIRDKQLDDGLALRQLYTRLGHVN